MMPALKVTALMMSQSSVLRSRSDNGRVMGAEAEKTRRSGEISDHIIEHDRHMKGYDLI